MQNVNRINKQFSAVKTKENWINEETRKRGNEQTKKWRKWGDEETKEQGETKKWRNTRRIPLLVYFIEKIWGASIWRNRQNEEMKNFSRSRSPRWQMFRFSARISTASVETLSKRTTLHEKRTGVDPCNAFTKRQQRVGNSTSFSSLQGMERGNIFRMVSELCAKLTPKVKCRDLLRPVPSVKINGILIGKPMKITDKKQCFDFMTFGLTSIPFRFYLSDIWRWMNLKALSTENKVDGSKIQKTNHMGLKYTKQNRNIWKPMENYRPFWFIFPIQKKYEKVRLI